MRRFLVVYEKTRTGWSAYVPDLPGCVATGRTRASCEKNMAGALEMHVAGMKEDGETIPRAESFAEVMTVT